MIGKTNGETGEGVAIFHPGLRVPACAAEHVHGCAEKFSHARFADPYHVGDNLCVSGAPEMRSTPEPNAHQPYAYAPERFPDR